MDNSLRRIGLCPAYRDLQGLSVVRKVFDAYRVANRDTRAVGHFLALISDAWWFLLAKQRQDDDSLPRFARFGPFRLARCYRRGLGGFGLFRLTRCRRRVLKLPPFQ